MSKSSQISVGIIGECMIELKGEAFGQLSQSWGGDTYNTALYLRRLMPAEAADIAYITGLGQDPMSAHLMSTWAEQGLDTQFIRQLPDRMPGLYQISLDDHGERTFVYWRGQAAAKYIFDDKDVTQVANALSGFDWVYLTGISLAILTEKGRAVLLDALSLYVEQGGKIAFDNNYRPKLWSSPEAARAAYRQVLAMTQLALVTEDDDQALWGFVTTEQLLSHYQVPELVIKRGGAQAWVRCLNAGKSTLAQCDAQRVEKVMDTTAAGDSFAAGYLAARLTGQAPAASLAAGHCLAARVIQYPGAIIPIDAMPATERELDKG